MKNWSLSLTIYTLTKNRVKYIQDTSAKKKHTFNTLSNKSKTIQTYLLVIKQNCNTENNLFTIPQTGMLTSEFLEHHLVVLECQTGVHFSD